MHKLPDPRGYPRQSACASLDEEVELWPNTPHWSYDPEAAKRCKREAAQRARTANDKAFQVLLAASLAPPQGGG